MPTLSGTIPNPLLQVKRCLGIPSDRRMRNPTAFESECGSARSTGRRGCRRGSFASIHRRGCTRDNDPAAGVNDESAG